MPFTVAQKALERLEWSQILARLAELCATPRARARLAGPAPPFEASAGGVRERLAETAQARAVLAAGDRPPTGGASDPAAALRRAAKGGALAPGELLELASCLAALRETRRFLALRRELAPRLAALAESLGDHHALEREIARCIDPSGELRDDASPALADARREARQLAAEIQARLERTLRDPDVVANLSDTYFTVRNDRYVLPVRADARGHVRGIVHDASGSGTTLYVEPEALVELNNRHKRAELAIAQEQARVLRALSARAAASSEALDAELEALAAIDLAFARAALAQAMDAADPEVGDEGVLRLPELRHPALPADESVPNDVRLGESFHVLVVSGPNAGGKTVTMKAVALAVLLVRAGCQVPAAAGARVDLFDAVLADIGDEQDIAKSLSTFSAHMANLAHIVDGATSRSLVVLDEIGDGTDPGEGAALAQAVLEALADAGARVVATTHFNLLKEMADVDPRFANASVEFDPETLAPTYRLRMGIPGASSATAVAARMGLRSDVVERAIGLLEREDRQLDRMLSELAAARSALEAERREAEHLREQTEAVRAEYGRRLARLQERRDELYRAMRDDLDRAFREAHGRVASVIAELQRGGGARDAARAREQLQALEAQTRRAEARAGLSPAASVEALQPIDWRRARPGDAVRVGGAGEGVLIALPDRRGRVAVRVGSARVEVPADRVGRAAGGGDGEAPRRSGPPLAVVRAAAPEGEGGGRCDLRGLRVDEALDRLLEALDRAVADGRPRLVVVHGIGSGALRRAVREHLADSHYVERFEDAGPDEGGDGATIAVLA
jgi:DNA mismatch repair protein MutS2